jgi:hypothetical protein
MKNQILLANHPAPCRAEAAAESGSDEILLHRAMMAPAIPFLSRSEVDFRECRDLRRYMVRKNVEFDCHPDLGGSALLCIA